jgi:hypothetical protein
VAQEVETLKLYLDIERMRFEERLRTVFKVEPGAAKAAIPSLLLQPLVENAIKYAVSPQEEGARISLTAQVIGNRLRMTVADTGPGLQGRPLVQRRYDHRSGSPRSRPARPRQHPRPAGADLRRGSPLRDRHPPEGGFTVIIEIPYEVHREPTRRSTGRETYCRDDRYRNARQRAMGTNA